MLKSILIVFLAIFSVGAYDSVEDLGVDKMLKNLNKIQEELAKRISSNRCLKEQEIKIKNNLHTHTVVCIEGENCVLKSNACPSGFFYEVKSDWEKEEISWVPKRKKISINKKKFLLHKDNSLIIKSVKSQDEGLYREFSKDKLIITEYFVTVHNKSIFYPFDENDFNQLIHYLERIDNKTDFNISIEWSRWSHCRCGSDKKYYRTRYGKCYVSPKLNSSNHSIIFTYSNNPFRCSSKLVAHLLPIDHDFVMFGNCNSTCDTVSSFFDKTPDDKEELSDIQKYYACLREQNFKLKNHLHTYAVVCSPDETCILKSNFCSIKFNKIRLKWVKDRKEINIDKKKFSFDKANSLVINSIEHRDEGFYQEFINNKTLISEYHVTIQNKSVYRPIYEKDFIQLRKFNDLADFKVFVKWNKWSECKCSELNKHEYRTRHGKCYISLRSNKSKHSVIFSYSNNPFRCSSKLVSHLSPINHDFLMYGNCDSICDTISNSNLTFKASFLNLPRVELTNVNIGDHVLLDCDITSTVVHHEHMNLVYWKRNKDSNEFKFNLKKRTTKIFVDRMLRLAIRSTNSSDSGNYTCYYKDKIKKIIHLRVNDDKLNERIYNYATQFGCAFVITTLILVNLFTFLQRNLLKSKLE